MSLKSPKLSDWLARLESCHPSEIELGLDRIAAVAVALELQRPAPLVISIAGTNGKGSCCALLDALLRDSGWRTGRYTSPHLLRFNERVRIDGEAATDADLCRCFERIEAARGSVSLTYFEFATLAALCLFGEQDLDVVLLEVGLGGRLDAVNLVDADIAVITSIALDHQDWLGDDLEAIAREKAGIVRPGKPLVYGEAPLRAAVAAAAADSPVYVRGADFDAQSAGEGWTWTGCDRQGRPQRREALPLPQLLLDNVCTALQVLALIDRLPEAQVLRRLLPQIGLAGRLQRQRYRGTEVLLDVAHNPAACARVALYLERQPVDGPTIALFAAMSDKDVDGMMQLLAPQVDRWCLVPLPGLARASDAAKLAEKAARAGYPVLEVPPDVGSALQLASGLAQADGRILVCGSFFTVAAALPLMDP